MADLEKAIQEMQHEKAMVEEKLQSPEVAVDFQKIQELTELFQKIEGQIASNQKTYDAVMEEWMGLQDS